MIGPRVRREAVARQVDDLTWSEWPPKLLMTEFVGQGPWLKGGTESFVQLARFAFKITRLHSALRRLKCITSVVEKDLFILRNAAFLRLTTRAQSSFHHGTEGLENCLDLAIDISADSRRGEVTLWLRLAVRSVVNRVLQSMTLIYKPI